MPRDGAGVYTLPVGNPVVTNTLIASVWANTTMSDIAAQLNNVLTRDGLLGPTGPFKIQDGTVAAPGLAFASEVGLGWYRVVSGAIAMAAGGARVQQVVSGATDTTQAMWPRATGTTGLLLFNQPSTNSNTNTLSIGINAAGVSAITTGTAGTATRGNLTLDAPNVTASGILHTGTSGLTIDGFNTGAGPVYFSHGFISNPNYVPLYLQAVYDTPGGWAGWKMTTDNTCRIDFLLSAGANTWGTIKAAAFAVQSDERGKEQIAPLAAQHSAFMGIQPIRWHWPTPPAPKEGDPPIFPDLREKWGFSAQNLAVAVPGAVTGSVTATYEDGKPLTASVDPVPILALTVLEVQDLTYAA